MAAAYFDSDFCAEASFELFVRSLPPERSYLIAAGLEQGLDYLERVRFHPPEIEYLRQLPVFRHISRDFFDYLHSFHFTGEVWAIAEGTPVFHDEPLLRVTAPIIEAQIVETFLLSTVTFQTMIASKAARIVEAAQGRDVIEFGTRRAHGPEAGTLAARAAYIGGCVGTSNVEAGQKFGIPVFGTLAHSFVMAYHEEEEAFRRFQQLFREHSVLLVDTYYTLGAIEKIIRSGMRPAAVRLDSGDLYELSREVRRKLDNAGLKDTKIFATSDLDEYVISELLARGAQVDAFGVGTSLATSKDAPSLGGVYKLVDVYSDDGPSYRAKLSGGKATYPGCKQVFRASTPNGTCTGDVIGRCTEDVRNTDPLLSCVMREGRRNRPAPLLHEIHEHARQQILKLPPGIRRLHNPGVYPVRFSHQLEELLKEFRNRFGQPVGKGGL
jgi:nicotinate phosphoribosyltransferase